MKPTYGRVSRYGMIAFASSLDQCGPLTRSVRDAALVLGIVAGRDARDSTSVDEPVPDYLAALTGEVRGMRLGVPRELFVPGMEPGVEAAVRAAIEVLGGLGADIVDVSLPSTDRGLATYYIIAPAEASANLARYDGVRYGPSAGADELWDNYARTRGDGFGPEVKRRIMLGTYALSAGYYDAYYVKAQQVRTLIKAEFDEVLGTVDAILAPTSPTVAFKIGAKVDDPLAMYLNDACTLPVNIAGLPGISVPCGLSTGCRWACRSSAEPSTRRPSCAWPMRTSASPASPTCGRQLQALWPPDCRRLSRRVDFASMPEISHVRMTVPDQSTLNRVLREGGAQQFPQWLYAEPGTESRMTSWGLRGRSASDARHPTGRRRETRPVSDRQRRLDRGAARAHARHGRPRPGGERPGARAARPVARRRRRRASRREVPSPRAWSERPRSRGADHRGIRRSLPRPIR